MRNFELRKLNDKGASFTEYVVLLGLLATLSIGAVYSAGGEVTSVFSGASGKIATMGDGGSGGEPPVVYDPNSFVIEYDMSTHWDNVVVLGIEGNGTVDWGSAALNASCPTTFNIPTQDDFSCDMQSPGPHTIIIDGTMTAFGWSSNSTTNGISRMIQFGNTGLTSLRMAFYDNYQLTDVPPDLPSTVTDLSCAFCVNHTINDPDIGLWDVSNVTDMSSMFNQSNFNQDISGWNVSNVTNMWSMFLQNLDFNQDISSWDVSSVQNFNSMFRSAIAFDQPIGSWNTMSATNMYNMFADADAFNQPIGGWNTSNVTDMRGMFQYTNSFNQDISGWDVSNVTTMSDMFRSAFVFDQDLSPWNLASVTYVNRMFRDAPLFNGAITTWQLPNVVTSRATEMFRGATNFAQDLSGWCVPGITSRPNLFSDGSSIAAEPIWGTACP